MQREDRLSRLLVGGSDETSRSVVRLAFLKAQKASKRSRSDFARAIGIAPSVLGLVLAGDAEPTCSLLLRAAEVAGQTVGVLLGEESLTTGLLELEAKIHILEELLQTRSAS